MMAKGPIHEGCKGVILLPGGLEMVYIIRQKSQQHINKKLSDIWLPDAPFTCDAFVKEMKRYGILNENSEWVKYEIRGHHQTQAFHLVGCYEALHAIGCLPELSWPKVMKLFNNAFKTRINNAKVLQTKSGKRNKRSFNESDYFHAIFSGIPRNA